MKNENIDFYYFSGTGNTFLAALAAAGVLEAKGFNVRLMRMETAKAAAVETGQAIGLAFPVACLGTYPFVWDFIRALPKANGTEVFMLATMGGRDGALTGPMGAQLRAKGYITVGAAQLVMPTNIFVLLPQEKAAEMVKKALAKAAAYGTALADGTAVWPKQNLTGKILYNFLYRPSVFTWKIHFLQKLFIHRLTPSACTKCGLCAKICPVGNISMEGGLPKVGLNCQYCLRCVSFCPTKALRTVFNYKGQTYKAAPLPYRE